MVSDKGFAKLSQMAKKQGIQRIADKLGYSYAYIHQVLAGNMPVSKNLRQKLTKKPPHKPTVTVRYEVGDPRRERALGLDMEERRRRLDRE